MSNSIFQRRCLWCFIIFYCIVGIFPAHAQEQPSAPIISESLHVDWATTTILLQVVLALELNQPDQLIAAQKLQHAFNKEFPARFESLLRPWKLDSLYTIEEEIELNPHLRPQLARRLSTILPTQSRVSPDFTTVTLEYAQPLYPLITELFYHPIQDVPIQRFLPWRSTQDSTGIVIYAQEPLPLVGTAEQVHLQVSLFPEIYGGDLQPLLKREQYDSDAYASWGILAYTTSLDETPFVHRIGLYPLRIAATKINGVYPTDIVLDTYDTHRILHSEQLINLLKKGRVLVIVKDDQFMP